MQGVDHPELGQTSACVEYLLHNVSDEIAKIGPASPTEVFGQAQSPFGYVPRQAARPARVAVYPDRYGNVQATHPEPALLQTDFQPGISECLSALCRAEPFSKSSTENYTNYFHIC